MSILGYFIVFSVVLLLATVWVWCLIHIVARPDLGVGTKVLWLLGTLIFPVVGAVAYIIFSHKRGPVDDMAEWEDKSAEEIEADAYRAAHMTATDRAGDRPLL